MKPTRRVDRIRNVRRRHRLPRHLAPILTEHHIAQRPARARRQFHLSRDDIKPRRRDRDARVVARGGMNVARVKRFGRAAARPIRRRELDRRQRTVADGLTRRAPQPRVKRRLPFHARGLRGRRHQICAVRSDRQTRDRVRRRRRGQVAFGRHFGDARFGQIVREFVDVRRRQNIIRRPARRS